VRFDWIVSANVGLPAPRHYDLGLLVIQHYDLGLPAPQHYDLGLLVAPGSPPKGLVMMTLTEDMSTYLLINKLFSSLRIIDQTPPPSASNK